MPRPKRQTTVAGAQVAWAAGNDPDAKIYEHLLELLGKRDASKVKCPACDGLPQAYSSRSTPAIKWKHRCQPYAAPVYFTNETWFKHCREHAQQSTKEKKASLAEAYKNQLQWHPGTITDGYLQIIMRQLNAVLKKL